MFNETTLNRPSLPTLQYIVLPEVLLIVLIALRPPLVWRVYGFTIYASASLKALSYTTGDSMKDYSVGNRFTGYIALAAYLLFLTDPVTDFHHERDLVSAEKLPLVQRAYWVLTMKFSSRLVGYNRQVANMPRYPTRTRHSFATFSFLRALYFIFLLDVLQAYIYTNPLFSISGPGARPVTAQGHILSYLNIFAWNASLYCIMSWPYYFLAAVFTAIGLSEPRDWPDIFGQWGDAYTVRRFWGQTWHQLMRRFLVAYGKAASTFLGFRPGTAGSRYTQLYAAFIISGLVHCGGDYMVDPRYLGSSFLFFLMQAVAITCEDGIIALAGKAGIREQRWTRLIGYAWVTWWFRISSPYFIDWAIEAGVGRSQAFPFSMTRTLMGILNIKYGSLSSW